MNNLIVPCAGKSSRYPNMKPKYMLTHPDGCLMIEKSLSGINQDAFDRIIITIVKPHVEQYDADLIMQQVFKDNPKVEICILDNFTSCASETVFLTIKKMQIQGSLVIKDSDNYVAVNMSKIENAVIGYDLHKHRDVPNIAAKSFIVANEQGIIQNIIEKQIVSNIICLGVYCFEDASNFVEVYEELKNNRVDGELYVSHVISYMIAKGKTFFLYQANDYEDWGTIKEWQNVQKRFRTYFVDVDGVLMKNSGKYGKVNWYNNNQFLTENIEILKNLQKNGAQIIITTSRTEEFRKDLTQKLINMGLKPYAILMGLNHSARVIINDFAPTNPYPSGIAISLPRNENIEDYIDY